MNLKKKLAAVEITDTGRVRDHNEDDIGSNLDAGLFVLADGMGGYNAGEVASSIAVKTVLDLASEACNREDRAATEPDTGMMRQTIVLRDAIARSNKIIHQTANSQSSCEGMGTTIVACLFYDDKISIAHVGDSRLYRVRQGRLEQITMDHSLLQELVDRGAVEPDDVYLLCSDGLPDMVDDDDIHLTISTFSANLETVGQQLVQLANDHGGKDNVSVMLIKALEPFPATISLLGKLKKLFGIGT